MKWVVGFVQLVDVSSEPAGSIRIGGRLHPVGHRREVAEVVSSGVANAVDQGDVAVIPFGL